MKKKTGLILVCSAVVALAICALPAFAAPLTYASHDMRCPENHVCSHSFIDENNNGVCDHAEAGYCRNPQQNYRDNNNNGVCDCYEARECRECNNNNGCENGCGCGISRGYENGCGNGNGACDGTGPHHARGCGHGKRCNW